ncbi:site-specific DNA-methyltransferase [Mariniflexile sp. AS56]|uniref:site-specific DNA-methyltransferase n=1 Tax=Mariniflexile sp. AS56 TaxID=3063957 RepID=UPI0026F0A04D|nr:site-specific DNA-methyltransferase [Mariniflexile sp. AS56]MDO7172616.1 site-specific DNA-methyltransferase [Mariniflexile sp. AS56]
MEQIKQGDHLSQSENIVETNIDKLKALFPEIVTEGKIDFKVLQEVLGNELEEGEEYYRFTWAGKANARREAQKPSTGTLRPAPEESVDWDTTQNLYIEGDNLEVLKLLQKSYAGKVKMIYIDPPYNTGKDFVYKDNYKDNLRNYQEITGQVDEEGNKLSTNSDSDGRFHSNWLNMMYPRLRLARNLLKEDGVIFMSIDDNEFQNLIKLANDVFGENNFVENLVWKRRATPPNDRIIGKNHEYLVIFAKSIDKLSINLQPRSEKLNSRYSNPDEDPRGNWVASDLSANGKGGRLTESCIFDIKNPETGKLFSPPANKCWLYNREKVEMLISENRIGFRENSGSPFLKRYLSEVRQGSTLATILDNHGYSQDSAKEIKTLFSADVFDFPKPTKLLKTILTTGTKDDEIVLDFFSGSASSAVSILELNSQDDNKRRFIQVQLPEQTDKNSEAFKEGYKTITEIGKERIRRASKKIAEEYPEKAKDLDLGFKVFKLDTSNIKAWDGNPANLDESLFDAQDNVKTDRTEHDVLYEILLKYGLDLTLPIEEQQIEGKTVFSVGFGALFICLADTISSKVAEGIGAWKEELQPEVCRVVFKDTGFTDVEKTNSIQILKRFGITEIKSI